MGPTIEEFAKSERFAARLDIVQYTLYALVAGIVPALLLVFARNAYGEIAGALLSVAIVGCLTERIISRRRKVAREIDRFSHGAAPEIIHRWDELLARAGGRPMSDRLGHRGGADSSKPAP